MSNDWTDVTLGEICSPKQWHTIGKEDFSKTGYPVYGANGIIGLYKTYNHAEPVIAVTCRGATCGSISLTKPFSYVTGNSMCLDEIRGDVDTIFLFHFLLFSGFKDAISGSAQPQITRGDISKTNIVLPPLPEQKKIAEILSGINLCISSTKRKLAKREIMLQSIIGRLFMMPQASGDITGDHENDTPSVRRVPLKEVCTVRQGLQIPISERSKTRGKGMLPYLTVSWINSNFSIEKAEYIDAPRSSVILEEGEFVVARTGTVGRVFDGIRCVFHNNFFAVKCLPCINSNYLKHYLKSDALQNEMLERAGSTSIPDLNHGDFYSIEVPLHEPDNQKSIVAVIDSMESEICQIKKSIDALQNLLIGVSSDLLSGRKRVSV